MWPDLAIYWTLGHFLKPLATIKLPKSPTFLGSFCKGVKIIHFSSWNHIWATIIDIWRFLSGHTWCNLIDIDWQRKRKYLDGKKKEQFIRVDVEKEGKLYRERKSKDEEDIDGERCKEHSRYRIER